jgi:succinate dehydrogenase / fumarate reductase membrane anchor subunit
MSAAPVMRSNLARVRGSGAAHAGSRHFIAQRATAIALLLLAPWFAISAALTIRSYADAIEVLRAPWHGAGVILLALAAIYHMMLGLQVVIEDYIAKPGSRAALLLLNVFICVALAAAAVWAVLQINFGW